MKLKIVIELDWFFKNISLQALPKHNDLFKNKIIILRR